MRRLTVVCVALLGAIMPARAAYAVIIDSVTLLPATDTREVGSTFRAESSLLDPARHTVAGLQAGFAVVDGPNATLDLDAAPATPAGFFGTCVTGSSGSCAASYKGSIAGLDTIQAWADVDRDGRFDAGEPSVLATVQWVPAGAGVRSVRIDMQDCNGNLAAPGDIATWQQVALPSTAGFGGHTLCAQRFTSLGAIAPGPILFTIESGPGHFTDVEGFQDLGTSAVVQAATAPNQYNRVLLVSSMAGKTIVRAAAEGFAEAGAKLWTPGVARRVEVVAPASAVPTIPAEIVARVRDRFGNGVPGVEVLFSTSGAGHFANHLHSAVAIADESGRATVQAAANDGELGEETIIAGIDPATTDCSRIGADPAAGACSDEATIVWRAGRASLDLALSPASVVWGAPFRIGGTMTIGGLPAPARTVLVEKREGAGSFRRLGEATTNVRGEFFLIDRPSATTHYRARFSGDGSIAAGTSAVVAGGVRPGVILNVSPAFPVGGSAAVLNGRVLPLHAGLRVALQQLTPLGWRAVQSATLDGASAFSFSVVRAQNASMLFRVVSASDSDHLGGASANRRVTWR